MAVLPSANDLSRPASARTGRIIASGPEDSVGPALQRLGGVVSAIGEEQKRQQDALGMAKAEAELNQGLINVGKQFDNDPDYATFGERAPKVTGDIVNKAAQNIKDPNLRARWIEGAKTDAVRTDTAIMNKADALGQQATQASVDETLETQRRIFVDPMSTEEQRAKAQSDIQGTIEVATSTGIFSPAEAAARKQTYVENANFSRWKLAAETDPNSVLKLSPTGLQAYRDAIASIESKGSGDYSAIGPKHPTMGRALGRYQVMEANVGQWSKEALGREVSVDEFINSPEIQDAVFDHKFGQYVSKYGPEGAAQAWFAGEGGVGKTDRKDVLGTDVGSYGKKFVAALSGRASGDGVPASFRGMSPEQRQAVLEQAQRTQRENSVQDRASIDIAVNNAPVAIQNTGTYTGNVPTIGQFMTAYGPQEGAQRFDAFQTSVDTARQTFEFKTASNDEITAAVAAARPTSTGTGAALEQKRYDVLSKAAEDTIKARNTDPASYVMGAFPSVKSAWDNSQNGDYSQALAMTAAAQQRLGIQNMQLLPKSVAAQAVEAFKAPDANDQQKLGPVSSLVFATSDPKQRQAIFNQLVDAGLPAMTEGALEAQARGDVGAANRLLQAAVVDASKLPADKVNTPDVISSTLFENVWAPGSIGEASYGTSYGDASSLERAQRGSDLLKKAVQIRLAQGQDLESAVSGASKDLFGDKTVYTGSGNVNANLPVPTGTDADILGAGLEISKESIRQSLTAQAARATGQPVDKFLATPAPAGLAEKGNIDLTARPVVKNDDGSISTVRSMSFNEDGVEILIPTVSPDGKILSDDDAIKLYEQTGQHLGKFQTAQQADAYAEELHKQQERMYPGGVSFKASDGSKAVLDATVSNRINDILENGVFVPVGEGVGFRDPYTGTLVVDDKGNPISIPLARVIESGKPQVPADEPVEATPAQPAGIAPNPADTWDFMTLPGGNQ